MDATKWIIQQLECGSVKGWWTARYAKLMINYSKILSRTNAKTRTQSTETAIQWIIQALMYGVREGWYSQHNLNTKLSEAIGYSFPKAAPIIALKVPHGNIDIGIKWNWLNL